MRKIPRRAARTAAAAAALLLAPALALPAAGTAHAAGTHVTSADVPGCLDVHLHMVLGHTIRVTNNCADTQEFKVTYSQLPDSSCHTLEPGGIYQHSLPDGPWFRITGIAPC